MKNNIMLRCAVLLVILTLALFGMIAKKQYTLNTGKEIVLETQPIDPRSLFRGDYVRLNYVISDLNTDDLIGDNGYVKHDVVYVQLEQEKEYWQPVAVWREKPEQTNGNVFIKGKVQYVISTRWNQETKSSEEVENLLLRYGIENYFVPEGEGRELERRDIGKVDIRVAVDKFGNAGIKAVLVNGEEKYVESLL